MILNLNDEASSEMTDYIEMDYNELFTSRSLDELRYISRNDRNDTSVLTVQNVKPSIYACSRIVDIWCFIK